MVEVFVREKLLDIITPKPSQTNEDIFGKMYANKPNQFAFLPGERILIKELVRHVREIVGGGNLHHFRINRAAQNESVELSTKHTSDTRTHYLLNKLISAADRNSARKKGGFRYDSEIKSYASYLRLICGPLAYQTIQHNLEYSLPSLTSTNRYIKSPSSRVYEGVLRSEELLLYLNQRNLNLVVSLSVDATRIEGKPQYDSLTNQIIGFVLPLNEHGMPIPYSFPARNETEMCSHFSGTNVESTFLNVVMAQPVAENAKPFCLLAFGSDNRYTSKDISNSWEHIVQELANLGIEVLTIASDCDPKYSASMRDQSKLGTVSSELGEWFSCDENAITFFLQDYVHIGTKLRNFLLRTIRNQTRLPFGKYFINWNHLKILLEKFTKDRHQLTATVLNPIDRQNFSSVLKMCHRRVTELLKEHVKESEGTVFYLQMMNDVIEAFMNVELTPLQRIRKIWFPLFVIRIWRNHIQKNYSIKENFLTSYSYFCIEQNAHSLVLMLLHLKKRDRADLFLPHLNSSQPCESLFRQLRSFTPTYSTVTSCTIKSATSIISKIQYQYDVVNQTSEYFVYPQAGKHGISNKNPFYMNKILPTRDEIVDEILKCKRDAIRAAKRLGFTINRSDTYSCKVPPYNSKVRAKTRKRMAKRTIDDEDFSLPDIQNIQLKNYANDVMSEDITETSPYVEIKNDGNDKRFVVKKTSLVWYLRKDCQKLSSDRLLRVQNPHKNNVPKGKKKKLKKTFVDRYKPMSNKMRKKLFKETVL